MLKVLLKNKIAGLTKRDKTNLTLFTVTVLKVMDYSL